MIGLFISLCLFFSAVIIHEFSHAFIADKLGDSTARKMGRLTLNPIVHIDLFGTILLPLMLVLMNSPVLFGWAKPVPINFASLKNPKKDMLWVGLAGPMANLLFALAASIVHASFFKNSQIISVIMQYLMNVNVVLAVFNLIPIPPLDGSRVLMGILPARLAIKLMYLERYGVILLFALLYAGLFNKIIWPAAEFILNLLNKI